MKTSDIIQQLPNNPMLNPLRSSLEASITQFGDQEISLDRAKEIEGQVRAFVGQFQLQH
jgi:hypothetical protein